VGIIDQYRFRLLCFGSRDWANYEAIDWAINEWCSLVGLELWSHLIIIHGDNGYDQQGKALWGQHDKWAVKGADKLCGKFADEYGIKKRVFTPDWARYQKAAGSIRNQVMQRVSRPTHGLCFHNNIEESKGSINMYRRLVDANVPTIIVTEESWQQKILPSTQ
jgi:hypothetical protein